MIVALVVLALMWWIYWLVCSVRSSHVTMTAAAPQPQSAQEGTSRGLEDDPEHWNVGPDAWTALDDLQLTRLLVESASMTDTAANATGSSGPRVEHEDVP
jgi:hypothetical protein